MVSEGRRFTTIAGFNCFREVGKTFLEIPDGLRQLEDALPLRTTLDGELVAFDETGNPKLHVTLFV